MSTSPTSVPKPASPVGADDVVDLTLDELRDREDDYIAKADDAWRGAEWQADSPEERERFLRIEQQWAQKLEVVQARLDEIEEREWVAAHPPVADTRAPVADCRVSAPRDGARARGAGRPPARRVRTHSPPSDDDDGLADSDDDPPSARRRRARRRARSPPRRPSGRAP
jgi:hypothetical protein